MGYLPEWFQLIPQAVLLTLVLFLPGALSLRALGVSWGWSAVLGPAWTGAIVGVLSFFLYPRVLWGPTALILISAVSIALCGLVGFLLRKYRGFRASGIPLERYSVPIRWATLVSAIIMLLVLTLPVMFFMDPSFPQGKSDPMYHYNVVNAIEQKGAADSFYAARSNYGVRVLDIMYPTVWHALISVVAEVGNIVHVSHLLAYFVIPLVWTVGIVALGFAAFPRIPLAAVFLPAVSLLFPVYPGLLTGAKGFWPNSLAMSMVPGILAFIVWRVNHHNKDRGKQATSVVISLVVALGAFGGASITHPSVFFALLITLSPVLIMAVGRQIFRILRSPRTTGGLAFLVGTAAFLILVGLVFSTPHVQIFLARDLTLVWEDVPRRLISSIILWSAGTNIPLNVFLAFAILIPTLLGASVALKHRSTRWIVLGWVIQWAIILGSLLPLGPLTQIAGLWYHDPHRLYAVQVMYTASLFSLFIATLYGRLQDSVDLLSRAVAIASVSALLAVGFGAATVVLKMPTIYQDAKPKIGENEFINSRDELGFIESIDDYIPAQSVIIGDPTTGIGYAPAYSDVNTVFSQMNIRFLDWDGKYLFENFDDIHTDPAVCEILSFYRIEYFYEDDPVTYFDVDREDVMPGFYDVDTSTGFELVASTDGGRLWQITACGDMGEPNWWEYLERRYPLVDVDGVFEGNDSMTGVE